MEQKYGKGGGDATGEMKKQAQTKKDQKSELNIGKAAKPVKKQSTG